RFDAPAGGVSFGFTMPTETEISGPLKLRLHVELVGGVDAHLFVAVRKFRGGRHVCFQGSFGFGRDVVTKGWLRVAHRRGRPEPLGEGQIAPVEIEILSSSTLFRPGEVLWLDIQGHWFWKRNPLFGTFPSYYQASPPATVVLRMGARPTHICSYRDAAQAGDLKKRHPPVLVSRISRRLFCHHFLMAAFIRV
ncbi:MAG: CocE/NonD family hydrolase C-terminal non-catalytic domain-containing protein, partial [Bryobacteraceae bacterium]